MAMPLGSAMLTRLVSVMALHAPVAMVGRPRERRAVGCRQGEGGGQNPEY